MNKLYLMREESEAMADGVSEILSHVRGDRINDYAYSTMEKTDSWGRQAKWLTEEGKHTMLSDMKAVKEGIYELTKDSIAQKNPNLVQQIEMTQPDADTFHLGDTLQLEIAVQPTSAAGSVHWNSSDDAVASVDENGLVTMKKEGKATITVCSADNANIAQSIEITVVVPEEKKALLQEWAKASELKKEHYTTASWAVLERIIEEADAILMKNDAGTQEIENVLIKLKEAIGNLKKAEITPPGNPGQDQKEPLEKGKVYRVGTENYVILSTAPAKAALAGSTAIRTGGDRRKRRNV